MLTKHPPLEPGPEGNYHLTLKGNHHLILKVDVTATATATATASRFGGFKIHSRYTQDRLKINAISFSVIFRAPAMLLNSLSAPADLANRLADVTYQIVALQTLNHAMGTDHPSLTDAIVDAAQHRRITGREERILQDLNDQANASKHDDLGPGRLYRPSLEGGPHLRKVVIVSGPESSVKWEELTELVALSAGALDEVVVGSFPMEGKAKRGPYVAVQSAMAAPTLLPPCWGVGRDACRGPPTSRSGRPRSVSV